ncbi:MAG: EAL domain-containing protein [Vibrio sp.]|uniref:EAL domain-containing protein n=1 Tax=Vibrio sp. TaxID=678 RepID=UPI003A8ABF8A
MKLKRSTKNYIYIAGLFLIIFLSFAKYYIDSQEVVAEVSEEMSSIVHENINYYKDKMSNDIPLTDCGAFLQKNSALLLFNRDIRSIGVTDNNTIACSSASSLNGVKIKTQREEAGKTRLFYLPKSPYLGYSIPKDAGAILLKISYSSTYATYFAFYPETFSELMDNYSQYDVFIKLDNASIHKEGVISGRNELANGELYNVDFSLQLYAFLAYFVINHGFIIMFWTLAYLVVVNRNSPVFDRLKASYWDVNKAIRRSQFHPYLQPVFDINGTLTGAEVLVRWIHPSKGIIPPNDFINEVEANGKIKEITRMLMEKCSLHLRNADYLRNNDFHLGFNVCAVQFDSNDLYEDVVILQQELAANPIKIVLEITERHEFENEVFTSYISRLKARDVIIALDDFGTGHCSMKYLINTSIDVIKIDRTFINTISSGEDAHVLEAIINLAKTTNVEVLAEGVETQEQFNYLHARNIGQYQGFFFDKPLPIEEFIAKYFS